MRSRTVDARSMRTRHRIDWWVAYCAVWGVGLVVTAIAFKRSGQLYLGISVALWVALLALWVKLPRVALGATIFLVTLADLVTVSWFPALKNLSSRESIMFLSNSLTVSPFEITLVWALGVTAYHNIASTGRPFVTAPLLRPMLALMLLVAAGFVVGLSRGGDSRAAVYEVRPLIYLPLAYLLVVNVCRTTADYRRMFWAAVAGVFVQSLLSLNYLLRLSPSRRDGLESLNEHGSAIGMNLVLTMTVLALVYRGVSWRVRLTLIGISVPVLWVYLVNERRAAFIGLAAAMILLAVILFWRQRRTFWKVVPISVIVFLGYTGAFWHSTSSVGFPSQAVKSVISPNSLSAADRSSDDYRKIEIYDLNYTIRSSPITGQGFGKPFLRPIPLADISFFEFNAYLPHNSLLWIWVKMGFFGFVAVLYLFVKTLMLGADRVRRAALGLDLLAVSSAVMFVMMYAIYVYVDVAWEARNVTLLALSMGLCTAYLRDPVPDNGASGTSSRPRLVPAPALTH
jgi:hypothetical protein